MYKIRRVLGDNYKDVILPLHRKCFAAEPLPEKEAWWWVVLYEGEPVGFAGMQKSSRWSNAGYLSRCGVVPEHRGRGLQKRLIQVRERYARKCGFDFMVTDTRENPASANNLIRCGYTTYEPKVPWSFKNATYWKKLL